MSLDGLSPLTASFSEPPFIEGREVDGNLREEKERIRKVAAAVAVVLLKPMAERPRPAPFFFRPIASPKSLPEAAMTDPSPLQASPQASMDAAMAVSVPPRVSPKFLPEAASAVLSPSPPIVSPQHLEEGAMALLAPSPRHASPILFRPVSVWTRVLPPLPRLTYDHFSDMIESEAESIMASTHFYISLASQTESSWHNWGVRGAERAAGAFHFSISHSPEWVEKAFRIIFPRFIEIENCSFKIINKMDLFLVEEVRDFRNLFGKEFVFFESWDSLVKGGARERVSEGGVFQKIVKQLKESAIPKGKFPVGSVPVKGGEGYLYFRPFHSLFETYVNPIDLAEWDFTRREALLLHPEPLLPPIEDFVLEEDSWANKNKEKDWSNPTTYLSHAFSTLIVGYKNDGLEKRPFASWMVKLIEKGITLDVYLKKAVDLRDKAMEKLQVNEKDYPLGCLMPAIYYHFVVPMHDQFFLKKVDQIDSNQPFKSRPNLEKRLVIAMTAALLREKGVQYLHDFPRFIKPLNRFQGEKAVMDWLDSLMEAPIEK